MDEKHYEEMVFAIDRYSWNCTNDEARTAMWKDIAKFLQLLTKNDYVAVVYDDDTDIIVVQYNHDEHKDAWGVPNPYWITDDEYYYATESREVDE